MASEKAGITSVPGDSEDNGSGASEISDDEQSTTLDPVLDVRLIDLFNSDTEDEDFDGFWTELIAFEMNIILKI